MTDSSTTPIIDKLVKEKDFVLLVWNDNYSIGNAWACCLPYLYQCEVVRDSSDGGDLTVTPETEYLLNAKWLPVLNTGSSAMDAIQKLEARLATLPTDFLDVNWVYATGEAIEYLIRTQKKYKHDPIGIDGNLKPLPTDYNEIKFPQGLS